MISATSRSVQMQKMHILLWQWLFEARERIFYLQPVTGENMIRRAGCGQEGHIPTALQEIFCVDRKVRKIVLKVSERILKEMHRTATTIWIC